MTNSRRTGKRRLTPHGDYGKGSERTCENGKSGTHFSGLLETVKFPSVYPLHKHFSVLHFSLSPGVSNAF